MHALCTLMPSNERLHNESLLTRSHAAGPATDPVGVSLLSWDGRETSMQPGLLVQLYYQTF